MSSSKGLLLISLLMSYLPYPYNLCVFHLPPLPPFFYAWSPFILFCFSCNSLHPLFLPFQLSCFLLSLLLYPQSWLPLSLFLHLFLTLLLFPLTFPLSFLPSFFSFWNSYSDSPFSTGFSPIHIISVILSSHIYVYWLLYHLSIIHLPSSFSSLPLSLFLPVFFLSCQPVSQIARNLLLVPFRTPFIHYFFLPTYLPPYFIYPVTFTRNSPFLSSSLFCTFPLCLLSFLLSFIFWTDWSF